MAFRNSSIVLDENLPIPRGQRAAAWKADVPKPATKGVLQERERKPLQDVSNTGKALRDVSNTGKVWRDVPNTSKALRDVSNTSKALRDASNIGKPLRAPGLKQGTILKGSVLKDNRAARAQEATKNFPKNSGEGGGLTEEEIRMCHEWAKEGFEKAPFTGTDVQKMEKDRMNEYVKKEVEEIMTDLHNWPMHRTFDAALGYLEETGEDSDSDDNTGHKMELWPEVHLESSRPSSIKGDVSFDDLVSQADADLQELLMSPIQTFRLKDSSD